MSLGFEQAGFDVKAAVEIDPIHCAIHAFNFPECAIIPKSVVGLSANEIRKRAGITYNEKISVVFGGPPCQGFSMMGKRSLDDPRNRLVLEFVRLVAELKADYFVFENVKGITVGSQRRFLEEIIQAFRDFGYEVREPWHVLDAADYGVPQHRERLILIGARKNLELPPYPERKCIPADDARLKCDLPMGPTCAEAIGGLPDVERFEELNYSDEVNAGFWVEKSFYAKEMRCESPSAWHYGYRRHFDSTLLTSSNRTEHTDISRRRFSETVPGDVEPISRFFRLPPSGLSNTLRAGTDQARGAFTSPRPIHFRHNRCVTVREMARLHGFPDWFRFHVTKWHGGRQIGNAVAPPVARVIASEIIKAAGFRPQKPRRVINLVNPELLRMEMSAAARYFDIVVPIAKRDKHSGMHKRKQIEIEQTRLEALEVYA